MFGNTFLLRNSFMSRCLSLLVLICATAMGVPVFGLDVVKPHALEATVPTQAQTDNSQAGQVQQGQVGQPGQSQAGPRQPQTGAAPSEAGTPSSEAYMAASSSSAQFMAWSDGRCVTLRYAVRAAGCPNFYQAGGSPSMLTVNYFVHPGVNRVYVGEVCFIDYGYNAVWIPFFGVYLHILRCNDPPYYAQAMAYSQCGTIIVQTLDPGNAVARLQVLSFSPLAFRKIAGYCPCDTFHCGCHGSCHHHCGSCCYDPCHSHCHHHWCCLCVREGAVHDWWQPNATIWNTNNTSFQVSIVR
ncbi:MAG: hypothetical protein ACTHK7_00035 [Aureliella sp.]